MTEFELFILRLEAENVMFATITLFVTILFAYFVVAHIAGKSISGIQLKIVNTVYTLVMLAILNAMYNDFFQSFRIYQDLVEMNSRYVPNTAVEDWMVLPTLSIYFIAFLVSLYYMRISRKKSS